MTSIREHAPAKINLTLEIAGRRDDGLHELASLVAFADIGDVVTLDPGGPPEISVSGPFAAELVGVNILERAAALLKERAPQLAVGTVHLEKHLPVAAGVGGGSADAGALLRAVRKTNEAASDSVDWHGLARALGADVPVCLEAWPLWMTGTGDALAKIAGGLPPLHAVLVNPMAEVPEDKTACVFRMLGARPLRAGYTAPEPPRFGDRDVLLDFMRARGNDLAVAAEAVVPETGVVHVALAALPGVEYVAVSGAGPTSFGVFPDKSAAEAARKVLSEQHGNWWIAAVALGETNPLSPFLRGGG
ncbi:4-(cytidine 5'-diphospho)-2-C-methyl-D-erythritol kinase [Hyphomicrobium sp.]|uniref:4-(cytidine 5'-diphospho)-2-C-methyl-D-erythritol kinase n=1 Tax=Hyphomicrobium sp. TaxID=82 RepID=UPI0025C68B47|nr:4-(cytidine 5'-diphospho)-2-C-methyl-D-erythritol kinase [Hyphomicrobium sp.]MCC7250646.1 4-(cytidine 5'-diphospho)-2-C-methyl-D-erythritol kinase [Hyphomicrobium sp.]